ncbi:MAG: prolyl oligopeptidase family serine peptidase [Elusimicrobia bacterium]|nr:prolyl oligopeptidase family serine peptidase [Elusimicrobiota bacterium]
MPRIPRFIFYPVVFVLSAVPVLGGPIRLSVRPVSLNVPNPVSAGLKVVRPGIGPAVGAPAAALPALAPKADVAPSAPEAAPALVQAEAALPARENAAGTLDAAFDGSGPPATRRDESVADDYFGVKVKDPYRWLEDDNSEETKAWAEAQNRYTEDSLSEIPERKEIVERLKQLWNYEHFTVPEKVGKHWIYFHNSGLQNQDVLYKARRLYGERQVLLDPNTLASDGTAALSGLSFSEDGRLMAYGISRAGSDWKVWRVRDVETGRDLPDEIHWAKFTGVSWAKDGKGFYYTRFPEPKPGDEGKGANENAKVYFHKLGDKQERDVLVYERPDHPDWTFGVVRTEDERHLLLYQDEGTEPKNRIFIKDLRKPGSRFKPLFDAFDAQYSIIDSDGDRFYVHTTKDAPRGKLVAVDIRRPEPEHWTTVIPQSDKEVLRGVTRVGKRFVAVWEKDAHGVMRVYGPRGALRYEVALPALGSVSGLSPSSRRDTRGGYLSFSSFNHPRTNFHLNLDTGKLRAYRRPKVPMDPSRYEVKQVFYPSKDGTSIPMFIVHKKGLKLDGANPTYLYGYGGFNISLNPYFSGANVAWLERGGIYAVANLRGGGEYGQEWHDAGRLDKKQNVFDDFIAAAEYLIREKYTSTPKLAIGGGSNGGLLVGAVMTQRPDLFAAAAPEVGVLDMLRFHLFTIGAAWKSDYGSSETKEGFETLIKYSPLHNVRPGTKYPETMVMTGDHDDRVVPAHSFKFAAALQAAQAGLGRILLRVERDAGHGAGKPLEKQAQEIADLWAFLLRALGVSRGTPRA